MSDLEDLFHSLADVELQALDWHVRHEVAGETGGIFNVAVAKLISRRALLNATFSRTM